MSDKYPHVQNAIIESADVQLSRGFALDCWLHLKYGKSGGQGFGGYVLGGTDGEAGNHAKQPNLAAEFICSVMKAAGVERMSDLPGKTIRVGKDDEWGMIRAIGHITDDDKWFEPKERLEKLLAKSRGEEHTTPVQAGKEN